jgi:methyl coenzyme M reductase beta subunit
VKASAQLRLAELVNPALATIAREMTTSPFSAVRLRAAQDVLDRAGIGRQGGFIDGREGAFELVAAKLAIIRGEIKQ